VHQTKIRREIIDRVLARRGRVHWFDVLDPAKTALVVVDMQNTFCEPGGPAEVPSSRADEVRQRTIESLAPGRQRVWTGLTTSPRDLTIIKNRYSALIAGSSSLERVLRSLGVDTVLIAGTKTNVCCEATARDAMMLDFKVVMVSDCCAALSDDEHRASLETIIQQFGDVLTGDEVFARLDGRSNVSSIPPPARPSVSAERSRAKARRNR
jgi:ureidoacrylate peracid hydrolase